MTAKWIAYSIGGVLCLTLVFSPIGVALIIWGRRQGKRVEPAYWDSEEDALAIGIVTSWDDFA